MVNLYTNSLLQTIQDKAIAALRSSYFWLFEKALNQRGNFYTRIIIFSEVLCFIEIWRKITDDKPVDQNSPLYNEINETIGYYLSLSSTSRENIPIFERYILRYNFIKWALRDKQSDNGKKYRDFIKENHLVSIIRKYINLRNYINYRATEELSRFETAVKLTPSAQYWESKFSNDRLPVPLQKRRRPRFIQSYLKKKLEIPNAKLRQITT